MLAAMALESVQPVPCKFLDAILGAANGKPRRLSPGVNRFFAFEMSPFHEGRAGADFDNASP